VDGSGVGAVVAGAGEAVALGCLVGVEDVPSANAGTVLAATAVHASAMTLRTVRRMNRSLSSVRPLGEQSGLRY
jgi:ribosomal protein S5